MLHKARRRPGAQRRLNILRSDRNFYARGIGGGALGAQTTRLRPLPGHAGLGMVLAEAVQTGPGERFTKAPAGPE